MAVYFQFNKDGEPILPAQADDEMREFFGEPMDSKKWLDNWYGTIGFSMACNSHEKSRADYIETYPDKARIVNFIYDHYEIYNGACR